MSAPLEIPRDWVACRCVCGNEFQVPPSMRGGLTNCPACKALVEVRAGFEILWALAVAGTVAALVAVPWALWYVVPGRAGSIAAGIALAIGLVVLFFLWAGG